MSGLAGASGEVDVDEWLELEARSEPSEFAAASAATEDEAPHNNVAAAPAANMGHRVGAGDCGLGTSNVRWVWTSTGRTVAALVTVTGGQNASERDDPLLAADRKHRSIVTGPTEFSA